MHSHDDNEFDPGSSPEQPASEPTGGGDELSTPAAEFEIAESKVAEARVADANVEVALAQLERRMAEQQEKYLRLAAEYDNYRKRMARERAEASSRAQADLSRQLLDALDDLARFAHVDPDTVDAKSVVQGAELVEKKLMKVLSGAGLEPVNPENQTFDPQLHEAVATEPALAPEDDHVVARVYQVGYLFNGQLLRPARVVVKQWNG